MPTYSSCLTAHFSHFVCWLLHSKTTRHPSFKVRFVVPSLEEGAKPEDGHEIGGCELDLMDLGNEGEETVVKSLDVQDSTEAVIGFLELEISSYILKVGARASLQTRFLLTARNLPRLQFLCMMCTRKPGG